MHSASISGRSTLRFIPETRCDSLCTPLLRHARTVQIGKPGSEQPFSTSTLSPTHEQAVGSGMKLLALLTGKSRHRPIKSYALPNFLHRPAILDTGCTTTLTHTVVNSFLHNARKSQMNIWGFSGTNTVSCDMTGTLFCYALGSKHTLDDSNKVSGTPLEYETNTLNSLNDDLMSIETWYEDAGYDLHLVHDGFSGLQLLDKTTGEIKHRIAVHRDAIMRRWYVDILIAKDKESAVKAGKLLEQQKKYRPTVLVAREPVIDTVDNIRSAVENCFDYCTAITIRNHAEQTDVLSSDFGGVSKYLLQISELEHDTSTERHFFSEKCYRHVHECDTAEEDPNSDFHDEQLISDISSEIASAAYLFPHPTTTR